MRIVADENMALVQAFFSDLGQLSCYSGRQLSNEQVKDADVLLVRSVTEVNANLLTNSRVRFVGSATIGADHLDKEWLDSQNITMTTAPACNARSVVEYILTAIAAVSARLQIDPSAKVLGIVGLGNVGFLLASVAQSLGIKVLGYDPFILRPTVQQCSFEELVASADIVSLHTPLTRQGEYPTYHLFNKVTLSLLKPNCILLNTGRGAVIDNQALLDFVENHPKHLAAIVLDVWEGEPLINARLIPHVMLVTPHIAGYSLEGRTRGTEQVYQALCQFLAQPPQHQLMDFLPVNSSVITALPNENLWLMLSKVLQAAYPIFNDDQQLRATMQLPETERALAFDLLRKHYWPRRQFASHQVIIDQQDVAAIEMLKKLDFLV